MIVNAHQALAWSIQTIGRHNARSVGETRRLVAGTATLEHNGQTLLGCPDLVRGEVGIVFAGLPKIGPSLIGLGYEKDDMLRALGGNWIRILNGALPTT